MPTAPHPKQEMENKPSKINRKYALGAPVIVLQSIVLQWIMFKTMKNVLKLTGNIRRNQKVKKSAKMCMLKVSY